MTAITASQAIRPFRVDIPEADLADLRQRLAMARLPEQETVSDFSQGVPLKTIQQVLDYWKNSYDWRKVEARINSQNCETIHRCYHLQSKNCCATRAQSSTPPVWHRAMSCSEENRFVDVRR